MAKKARVPSVHDLHAFCEYTDTFGGEANYSWVKREAFNCEGMSDLAITRKAKALFDLNGARGRSDNSGDMYSFRPYRLCTVLFVTTGKQDGG